LPDQRRDLRRRTERYAVHCNCSALSAVKSSPLVSFIESGAFGEHQARIWFIIASDMRMQRFLFEMPQTDDRLQTRDEFCKIHLFG
jgi:hypothetical protein